MARAPIAATNKLSHRLSTLPIADFAASSNVKYRGQPAQSLLAAVSGGRKLSELRRDRSTPFASVSDFSFSEFEIRSLPTLSRSYPRHPAGAGSLIPFAPFSFSVFQFSERAIFERFILQPDLNPLGAENETGRAERPTSWEARSQDIELCYSPISIRSIDDITLLTAPRPRGASVDGKL